MFGGNKLTGIANQPSLSSLTERPCRIRIDNLKLVFHHLLQLVKNSLDNTKAPPPAVCVECKKRANAKCVRKCCFLCCKKFSSTVEEFMERTVHKHVYKKSKRDKEEGEYQEET